MYSITQNGVPLDKSLYTIDEETKTFSSNESELVLDFWYESDWTFNTGSNCTFKTGHRCTFNTGSLCVFDSLYGCTFNTGAFCTFDIAHGCIFNTGSSCVAVRRDVYEVIELPAHMTIKLNGCGVKGYTVFEDVKEMKQEEIEKALGYKIKIV